MQILNTRVIVATLFTCRSKFMNGLWNEQAIHLSIVTNNMITYWINYPETYSTQVYLRL